MKRNSITHLIRVVILILFLAFPFSLSAQEYNLGGSVKDSSGEPLIGVNIMRRGTNKGAISDLDGRFSLTVLPTDTLVFTYIGFKTQRIPVDSRQVINVVMSESETMLSEVVVTALGIKRESRALGYSTENLEGDQISSTMPNNWSAALAGKVAGLNVVTPGGPLGSTRLSLRGDISLNVNSNGALIIIDGIPMSNDISNPGSAYGAGAASELSLDYGNGFADINPNDIADIQVLKGPSASALYGSRGANGVIIITTKSGQGVKMDSGIGVTYSSHLNLESVMRWPDYQYEFGQGLPSNVGIKGTDYEGQLYYSYGAMPDGNRGTSGTSSAYGARFDPHKLFYQYDPELQGRAEVPTPWIPYPNNRKELFRTGHTWTNTVALSSRTKTGRVRAALTYADNKWILPNTGYDRMTLSVAGQQKISRYITLDYSTSYTNREVHNTPALGYNSNSISYFLIFQNPNVNLDWLRPKWRKGLENIKQLQPYSSFIGNPFMILYDAINPAHKQSLLSSLSATIQFNEWLSLSVKSAVRLASDKREQHRPISDVVFGKGFFKTEKITDYEINNDFLLSYKREISDHFSLNLSAGGNMMKSKYDYIGASVNGLQTPGVFKLSNGSAQPHVVPRVREKAINSLYFMGNINYKNYLFLDVTGRNDWSSTLPEENRSFFYPSVSLSSIVNEIFSLPQPISFFKLRASWAQVGNDTSPYKTSQYYSTSNFPGSLQLPRTLYNQHFKPEISSNVEFGFDYRMFNDRLSFDFTYYFNKTKNQIIDAPIDPTTGYSKATINSGTVQNKGVELEFAAVPVVTRDFKWKTTINWSKNRNKILSLAEGSDEHQVIATVGSVVSLIGTVGGSIGDLWGYKLVRSPEGEVVIGANGLPEKAQAIEFVGNVYPDWKAGIRNELSYKGVTLSFLFDGQKGGNIYSQSHHKMSEQGKLAHTLNGRLPGTEFYIAGDDPRLANDPKLNPIGGVYMVAPGVVRNPDGSFSPNEKIVTVEKYNKEYYRRANVETNTFDASYIKLREVQLSYAVPTKLLKKTFIKGASLAIYGRNLLTFTKYPLYDPEIAALDGSSMVVGIENGSLPSTKSYGFNLNISF